MRRPGVVTGIASVRAEGKRAAPSPPTPTECSTPSGVVSGGDGSGFSRY